MLPSNELQRIIGSNCFCSELISSAQSALDISTSDSAHNENLLRKPKSSFSIEEDTFVVSQDDATSPTIIPVSLPDSEIDPLLVCTNAQYPEEYLPATVMRRGRAVTSLTNSASALSNAQEQVALETPQRGIVSELEKISQELRSEDQASQEKQSPNSFLSIKTKSTVVKSEEQPINSLLSYENDSIVTEYQRPLTNLLISSGNDVKISESRKKPNDSPFSSQKCSSVENSLERPTNSVFAIKKISSAEPPQCEGVRKTSSTVPPVDSDQQSVQSRQISSHANQPSDVSEEHINSETHETIIEAKHTDNSVPTIQTHLSSDHNESPQSDPNPKISQHFGNFIKPKYYKFSDFGRPEDFANCPKSTLTSTEASDLPKKQKKKDMDHDPENVSTSQLEITNENDSVVLSVPCSSTNATSNCTPEKTKMTNEVKDSSKKSIVLDSINHTLEVGDNPALHKLQRDDKKTIVLILAEGWKNQKTFKRRVTEKFPFTEKIVFGEILYAVFGDKIRTYVEFNMSKKERLRVRLKDKYCKFKAENLKTIIS